MQWLLMLLLCAEPIEVPDPCIVAVEVEHYCVDLNGSVGKPWSVHEIRTMRLSTWIKLHGPITEADRLDYFKHGAFRTHEVLVHYEL